MKGHANKIVIAMCSLALSFFVGCNMEEDLADIRREAEERKVNRNNGDVHVYHHYDNLNNKYLQWEWEREKSRRFVEEQRLKNARVRANTRKMLYEMELQRKLKELEKQQREMQRRR